HFDLSFCSHDPLPSYFYTLSLHDALPICFWGLGFLGLALCVAGFFAKDKMTDDAPAANITSYVLAATVFLFASGLAWVWMVYNRSEEHTSELQSRGHLVCRLLLEKKKQI